MKLTSSAFQQDGAIPRDYTCDGKDVSPALGWSGVPREAKSLALIMDDPDAPRGVFVHWVAFNLRPEATGLPERVPPGETIAGGGVQGRNDFGNLGYGGPCPPRGTHRYFFTLYALDTALSLKTGATKAQVVAATKGHVLAEAQLMGKYSR